MKFTVSRTELFSTLQKVIGVVPSRSTLQILTNVLFYTENGRIQLMGTDLELTLISSATADIHEEGGVAVPAKILNDVLKELPEEELQISVDENHRVSILSSNGHYKISGESQKEFPNPPIIDSSNEIRVPNKVIRRMIDKTMFATSVDELRPALTGVLFRLNPNNIQMVATDGHRLSNIVNNSITFPSGEAQLILPTKALAALMKNLHDDDYHTIMFNASHVLFNLSDVLIYSRVIVEDYPDFGRAIPQNNTKEVFVNTTEIVSSVKRISLFANTITNQIRLSLRENLAVISAEDMDVGGEAKEEDACNYTDEPMDIGYNATYLLDILRHIDTEEVKIALDSPITGALVYPSEQREDEEFLMLIMPVRLNS